MAREAQCRPEEDWSRDPSFDSSCGALMETCAVSCFVEELTMKYRQRDQKGGSGGPLLLPPERKPGSIGYRSVNAPILISHGISGW